MHGTPPLGGTGWQSREAPLQLAESCTACLQAGRAESEDAMPPGCWTASCDSCSELRICSEARATSARRERVLGRRGVLAASVLGEPCRVATDSRSLPQLKVCMNFSMGLRRHAL
eukprot:SAG11_NODE_659_length_7895_cov_18.189969_8_plen_115_part_00